MNACGGEPTRAARINPTPHAKAALQAWHVTWYLVHARDELRHLHRSPRPRDAASMRWRYQAYPQKRRNAKIFIECAAKHLAEAERFYAGLHRPARRKGRPAATEMRADAVLEVEAV